MLCIFAIRKVSQNLLFVCFDTTEPIQTEELEFLPASSNPQVRRPVSSKKT